MQTSQQSKRKFFIRPSGTQRLIAGVIFVCIAAFFALMVLAANEKIHIERLVNPCGFKQRFALPCPTCGITTSAVTFASGRIGKAFYIQPAGALLCVFLLITGIFAFLTAVFGIYFQFLQRFFAEVKIRYVILILLIIITAGWTVTLARELAKN